MVDYEDRIVETSAGSKTVSLRGRSDWIAEIVDGSKSLYGRNVHLF